MPQNTPMKRQFTTIDGRTVMSNLPQHWGGNDWKITGVDNPLPVGNYVRTEAGVWITQKGSDDGAADVRLTGSIVELFEVKNILIPAHSTVYVTDSMEYPTTSFAVAFRFFPLTLSGGYLLKFFERIGTINMATEFNIVDGDELQTYRGTASFESVIPEGHIRVDNLSDEEITLREIKLWGIL